MVDLFFIVLRSGDSVATHMLHMSGQVIDIRESTIDYFGVIVWYKKIPATPRRFLFT